MNGSNPICTCYIHVSNRFLGGLPILMHIEHIRGFTPRIIIYRIIKYVNTLLTTRFKPRLRSQVIISVELQSLF